MSTQANHPGGAAPTLGVGDVTSGAAGSTPSHETMAETGGSGGSQQTLPPGAESAAGAPASVETDQNAADQVEAGQNEAGQDEAGQDEAGIERGVEAAGSAATATARGAQDTRASQAGRLPDGLGTPETGGNQSPDDLTPPRRQ